MDKTKEYAKNTLILFLGKFSTQFLTFFLLPLYTHFLATDDYGFVDLIQTYVLLLVPILIFRIDSGVFRFLIDERDNENKKRQTLTSSCLILLIGEIFLVFVSLLLNIFFKIKYFWLIVISSLVLMTTTMMLQIIRGLGKNKEYAMCSFITACINLILNVILIVILKYNGKAIFIASIISNLFATSYLLYKTKLFDNVGKKYFDKLKTKEMLKYSIPMIPNALSWWIVNVSDRTIISAFLGVTFNGIYTISCKFSNILNSLFSIFNMSWQESASMHINDKEKNVFFSSIINSLFVLFSTISICIIGFLPLIYNLAIGKEYIDSYNYIPILMFANIWNVLIGLTGSIYIAKKMTKQVANTTIVAAVVNILINICFIKKIGLYAACLSTLISYFVMAIYRYKDSKKIIDYKLNKSKLLIILVGFLITSILYYINNLFINIINVIFVSALFVILNKIYIRKFITRFIIKR